MNNILRYFLLSLLVALLAGCQLLPANNRSSSKTDDNTKSSTMIVELPPKIITTDWNVILTPLVDELLKTTEINENNLILISDVKNSSGNYISSTRINRVIGDLLSQQDIFTLIDKQTVNQSKQVLGIPYDDAFVSRSKMIGLARHLQAGYLLFTTVNKTPQSPDIPAEVTMELLLTETGEIVWQFSTVQITSSEEPNEANQ